MATLRLFAVRVVPKLRKELQAKEKSARVFCMPLVARLKDVEKRLLEASDDDVLNLLDRLEALIQWPTFLRDLTPTQGQYPSKSGGRDFPGLWSLLQNEPWGKQNITKYAVGRRQTKQRTALVEYLATFECSGSAAQEPEQAELRTRTARQELDSSREYMKILHAALSTVRACKNLEIPANLRLRSCGRGSSPSTSLFRIFFLGHPHEGSGGKSVSCRWQDSLICVFRSRVATEPNSAEDDTTSFMTAPEFCNIISQNSRIQLRFKFDNHGGRLFNNASQMNHPLQGWKAPTSVSLLEILNSATKPSKKTRLLFCYQLAKAFWSFYGSEWMAKPWTKERVHFMFDTHDEPQGISLNDPYLAVTDPSAAGKNTNACKLSVIRSHQFPKILALGILLIEIELGLKIESHFDSECYKDGFLSINATHTTGQDIYLEKRYLWAERETYPQLQRVIATCLAIVETDVQRDRNVPMPSHEPFMNYKDNKRDLCGAIDEHIVRPLETLCINTWWEGESDPEKWESPLFRNFSINHIPAIMETPSTVKPQTDTTLSSQGWFRQLEDMNAVIRMKVSERDHKSPSVKIAILDTGICQELSSQVKGYRDFVNGRDVPYLDDTRHGTRIFQLLQRVCDVADFYVGRVWETDRATPATPGFMKTAIDWARDKWKVDIIVLPSGFRTSHDDIEIAIEDANRARILTFASPSNFGNCEKIYFPGCLYSHGKVLSLFSTNAMVRISTAKSFNPSPIETAKHRTFAILGENIALGNNEALLDGTSFSTAIGAGVAARILDFSRHRNHRHQIGKIEDLRKVEGMLAVFGRMAPATDNGYRCMAPWGIYDNRMREGEQRAQTLTRQRSEVCDALKEALRDIHKA